MDFPDYIPTAVRAYMTALIEGDYRDPAGWRNSLVSAEKQLNEIDGVIENVIDTGESYCLHGLRAKRAEIVVNKDILADDMACIWRLVHDIRMHRVFTLLSRKFSDDMQWQGFFDAAWSARMNFTQHREKLIEATELKEKIANTAEKLVGLIGQFHAVGTFGPDEFFSIPDLLRQTDNHRAGMRGMNMWRFMRRHITGDLPEGCPVEPLNIDLAQKDVGNAGQADPAGQARSSLKLAWRNAPDLSDLLNTVAKAARAFKPYETGAIGAAIESRKQNQKTEYLRAFRSLLVSEHGFALNRWIIKAAAIVSNVVINSPDVDVTYDDARKVFVRPTRKKLEDSPP